MTTTDAGAASEFDLYLDESGSFMETSTDPEERARDDEENKRRFPSQLAGLLVPRGALTEEKAFEILEHCHAAAGWPLPNVVHLNKYWQQPSYFQDQKNFDARLNSLVADLLEQLSANRFQPVRLVNIEGVNFGTKERYYTNMVAELFIRLCRQKQREGINKVSLHLTCAEVLLTVPLKRLLSRNEYRLRLREHVAMAAVRRGFAAEPASDAIGASPPALGRP